MDSDPTRKHPTLAFLLLCSCLFSTGCHIITPPHPHFCKAPRWVPPNVPRELDKVILPTYTIEPPDILSIDVINVVPKPSYELNVLDTIVLHVENTLLDSPISGVYQIESGGLVQLGPAYGSIKLVGMTVEEAREAVEKYLQKDYLSNPEVTLSLSEVASRQYIAGEHMVGPDGNVTLGSYGSVSLVGRTVAEAKVILEAHLSQFLDDPEVSLEVFAYNSKVYYVVTQGAGFGDGVVRIPVMGNETVIDAISQVNGLTQMSSSRIWVARPGKNQAGSDQILPVDWLGITQRGDVQTNYQLMPGDRVYVAEDKLVALDQALAKLIAPFERVMGFTLLGVGTATRLSGPVLKGGGNPSSRGGGF